MASFGGRPGPNALLLRNANYEDEIKTLGIEFADHVLQRGTAAATDLGSMSKTELKNVYNREFKQENKVILKFVHNKLYLAWVGEECKQMQITQGSRED